MRSSRIFAVCVPQRKPSATPSNPSLLREENEALANEGSHLPPGKDRFETIRAAGGHKAKTPLEMTWDYTK